VLRKDVKLSPSLLGCPPDWANILSFELSNHHINVPCAIHTADCEHNINFILPLSLFSGHHDVSFSIWIVFFLHFLTFIHLQF
jgi:hypothetical protein